MTITKTTEFCESDRYHYDQLLRKKGFATLDSESDAWYYGQWASPSRRVLFSYVEGDCITVECETDAEFTAEVLKVAEWHRKYDKFHGIDCGLLKGSKDMEEQFKALGLGELLH